MKVHYLYMRNQFARESLLLPSLQFLSYVDIERQ